MSMSYEEMTPQQVVDSFTDASFEALVGASTAEMIKDIAQGALANNQPPVVFTADNQTGVGPVVVVDNGTHVQAVPDSVQVLTMQPDSSINTSFGADSQIKFVVLGAKGESHVTFATNNDITVATQGGEGNEITLAGGNDAIILNASAPVDGAAQATSVTVDAGDGNDTVVLNMSPYLVGTASVNGGDGFDQVQLAGNRGGNGHHFSIEDGHVVMHSDFAVTMENMNVVVFYTNDAEGEFVLDKSDVVTVLAQDAQDSIAAKLYMVALGRQPIDGTNADANLGGIEYWMNEFANVHNTESAETLARCFLACPEFTEGYSELSNADFVSQMFANLNLGNMGQAVSNAGGMNIVEYTQQLNNGNMTRADVAWQIASSDEAAQVLGIDGMQYVIDDFGA